MGLIAGLNRRLRAAGYAGSTWARFGSEQEARASTRREPFGAIDRSIGFTAYRSQLIIESTLSALPEHVPSLHANDR